jgi:polysaccharide biosynthesis/export protein
MTFKSLIGSWKDSEAIRSKSRFFQLRLLTVMTCGMVIFLTSGFFKRVVAQQTSQPGPNSQSLAANASPDDTRYRIGPGDVLDVRVLKSPELSRPDVRVDQRGMIRMPMLEGDIRAACLTETELGQKIATLYLEYKRNPDVDVFVKDFQSQPVAVIGAVNNIHQEGTQFRLHRRVRLLELLTLAGGLNEHAGTSVNVVHAGGPGLCEEPGSAGAAESDLGILVSYSLRDTMNGVAAANPILRAGDIVVIPEGEQVYVVGNVKKPLTIPLKETLTVSQAVAMAGGTAPSTKRGKVRIVRQVPGSIGKQEIYVDLSAIEKRKATDVVLLPNDIVDVPLDGTKSFLRTLMGAVAPAISTVPSRIP